MYFHAHFSEAVGRETIGKPMNIILLLQVIYTNCILVSIQKNQTRVYICKNNCDLINT